jgi:ribosomal protein S18 acetylase RimI-like enzyme
LVKTRFGKSERGDNLEVIQNTLALGGCFLVMVHVPDQMIIGTSWITNDGRRLYLHHFGIDPIWQRKGLAKKLLASSLEFAKSVNLQIKLEVGDDNLAALKLYSNGGFKPLGDYRVLIIRKYD